MIVDIMFMLIYTWAAAMRISVCASYTSLKGGRETAMKEDPAPPSYRYVLVRVCNRGFSSAAMASTQLRNHRVRDLENLHSVYRVRFM